MLEIASFRQSSYYWLQFRLHELCVSGTVSEIDDELTNTNARHINLYNDVSTHAHTHTHPHTHSIVTPIWNNNPDGRSE